LWKAVGKQNPGAALMLAELYARGDGVPKSCDQARLLLVAAAKKGTPNADLRLRDLESNGCQ
jgi:TPR repeat protein